ncbi:MAG: tRNA (adenosine(37)-N6)-threonylcarbamoyltransferase complex ATPase subunit type 1 TsaE [Pseudomonadales bacterium]|nr:tRNA (adenosine(37)-N6)-threonylcarbamoyltransferase complex ATPase subunit type 1 TsaE [Pseudomonadales bacterium]
MEILTSEDATVQFGARLGQELLEKYAGSALVLLHGELGAGKTTLVRGMLRSMGHSGVVKSPTYTLLEPYSLDGQDAYHFDLYRINDPEELLFVGFDEIIDGPGLKLIEWPERADGWLPKAQTIVKLELSEAIDERKVTVQFNDSDV